MREEFIVFDPLDIKDMELIHDAETEHDARNRKRRVPTA